MNVLADEQKKLFELGISDAEGQSTVSASFCFGGILFLTYLNESEKAGKKSR